MSDHIWRILSKRVLEITISLENAILILIVR